MASTSLSWSLVQPEIARVTQTASYDRLGSGWSDPVTIPRDIEHVIGNLRALLEKADVTGPRILVGHSYGGLIARAYAGRYPAEVAGLVLVDPVAVTEWSNPDRSHRKMLRHGVWVARFCAFLTRVGIVRLIMNYWEVLAGIFSKPKIADGSSTHRSGELNRIVGEVKKLPRETWPLVKSHWCQTESFDAIARYFQALPSSAGAVANGPAEEHVLRNLPLIVLSAGNSSAVQRAEHEALAQSSSCGRLEVVSDSGHWMHFDRPDVVVRAVQDMVSLCRERATREA